jgi:hypothetical protein
MTQGKTGIAILVASVGLNCVYSGPVLTPCSTDADCSGGLVCASGLCQSAEPAGDGGGPADGGNSKPGLKPCAADNDCSAAPGTRCCTEDNLCHPMVAENADCDCAHPCPLDQGCFPGTCGATPQKCRPGCFPGSAATNSPADMCASQNGDPAYCSPLPTSQATVENKGGACAVGENCGVTSQNCPPYPLDRTMPVSTSNPAVAQTCTPVAPTVNACYPAGDIPLWGINCDQSCTMTGSDCAPGSICVTPTDSEGNKIGPSECRQQCGDPGGTNGCPQDRPNCEGTYAAGMVYYSTGVCDESPCESNADCAHFSATPCCNSNSICDAPGCQ